MNPYYQNWNYGYTLAPATDQSRGAYTTTAMYGIGQQGANQSNLASISNQDVASWAGVNTGSQWSEVGGGSSYTSQQHGGSVKTQAFVTSSNATLKQEVQESQMIGPVKPVPTTSHVEPAKALSKLHELAIANKLVERFEKIQEAVAGDPNQSDCIVKLFIGTESYEGKATTLKQAKQNAALQALGSTKYQTSKEKKLTMFNTARRIGVTATSELHEIAAKKGVRVDFKFLEPYNFEFKHSMRMWNKKDMLGNYRVQLNVAGYEFYGQAELPQQAKHNASTQALEIVRKMPDPSGEGKVVAKPGGVEQDEAEKDTAPVVSEGKNTTMLLNEIAMNNDCTPEWTLLAETGPAHARMYTWQLTIGDFATVGTGPSKKMARQGAADQMLATLPEEWKVKARRSFKNASSRFGKRKGKGGRGPPAKKMASDSGESEKLVITANNPVSCLHEYAKKKKIADPCFDVVSENVLDTVQKGTHSFKKIEYTMQLLIDGRQYTASALNKKAAKQTCAMEAWDYIRRTL